MTHWLILIVFVAYIAIDATAQGKLNLINRRFVPPSAQPDVNLPLHYLYPLCFALLAFVPCFVLATTFEPLWGLLALMLRLALFNPILNLTKGDPLFAVGTSSKQDKLMGRHSWVREATTLVAIAAAVVLFCHLQA